MRITNRNLGDEQGGFRGPRGGMNQLKMMVEEFLKSRKLSAPFMDLHKIYGRVNRSVYGVSWELRSMRASTWRDDTCGYVWVTEGLSESFGVSIGEKRLCCHHGCSVFTWKAAREMKDRVGIYGQDWKLNMVPSLLVELYVCDSAVSRRWKDAAEL